MQDNQIVELHSQILPNIDDGSGSVEMPLAMLRREAEQGVGTVCASSHYYAHREGIETFCTRRAEALERLTSAIRPISPTAT